jgi:hypothetical protein
VTIRTGGPLNLDPPLFGGVSSEAEI